MAELAACEWPRKVCLCSYPPDSKEPKPEIQHIRIRETLGPHQLSERMKGLCDALGYDAVRIAQMTIVLELSRPLREDPR